MPCDLCLYVCVCVCVYPQVEALIGDEVEGPAFVTISVLDINNHPPTFDQSAYAAAVRERSRHGERSPFTMTPPSHRKRWAAPLHTETIDALTLYGVAPPRRFWYQRGVRLLDRKHVPLTVY